MPRGRKSVIETTDLPIINTDIEEGTIPFFLIDKDYGVACDQYCYMLCQRKQATRTIKDEDGKPNHIETYYNWISFKYSGEFSDIISIYYDIKNKGLNRKLEKTRELQDIVNNSNEVKKIIAKAFESDGINKEIISFSNLIDIKKSIEDELQYVRDLKEQLKKEVDETINLAKEKRKELLKSTSKKESRKISNVI